MKDRTPQRATAVIERRPPVSATVQRRAATTSPSPAQALQQRLGNRGSQALISRTLPTVQAATSTAPRSSSVVTEPSAPSIPAHVPVSGAVPVPIPQKEAPAPSASRVSSTSSTATPPGPSRAPGAEGASASQTALVEDEAATAEPQGPSRASGSEPSTSQAAAPSEAEVVPAELPPSAEGPSPPLPATEEVSGPQAELVEEAAETAEPPPETVSPRQAIAPAARAVGQRATAAQAYSPVEQVVGSAQAAAIDPATEQRRGAAVETVAKIDAAEPGSIERKDFKTKLTEALQVAVPNPTTPEEAERLAAHGDEQASAALQGELQLQRDAAAGPIAAASAPEAEVSPEEIQPVPQTAELNLEQPGPAPESVSPASIVPNPLPVEQLDYSSDRQDTDALMAQNNMTSEQLQRGNDPDFNAALQSHEAAETNEATAPSRYREAEAGTRAQARGAAAHSLEQGLQGFHESRTGSIAQVAGQQITTQTVDAAERARITSQIEDIKNDTRDAVEGILEEMERVAGEKFETGLGLAEKAYEDVFEDGKGGFFDSLGDFFTGGGEERIQDAFNTARAAYDSEVTQAIDKVAEYVEAQLAKARTRVTEGLQQVDTFVESLDASVKSFGEEASTNIRSDFDAMTADIDQRRDALVGTFVQKYTESQQRLQATEQRLREENKGFWARVYDATVGVVQKVLEFKNLLLGILARAAAVVESIIQDPIGFLGNLISGIKAGLDRFVGNIGEHLERGLLGWLFGALQGAGLQIPDRFDFKGILSLVMQVLGLTYANIRRRAVGLLGEEMVSRLEQVAEIFKILITEGPAGLWRMLMEKLSTLKETMLEQIQSFVIERIVKAGIVWIISLLNPASAFVKACKMIYDIVMFFIERGRQIVELINAIINSLAAIVSGNIQAMAEAVEGALARALPVAISFLASLLGLGGISDKIREIIEKIQEPINKAIDWVINLAAKGVKAVGRALGFGKNKEEKEAARQTGFDGQIGVPVEYDVEGEHHKIFIVTDGVDSMLMVASKVKPAKKLLDEYEEKAGDNDKVKDKITTARGVAKNIDTLGDDLAKERRRRPPNEERSVQLDEDLEAEEQKLAKQLAAIRKDLGISSGLKRGTESKPILLDWPKPALSPPSYPVLWLSKDEKTLNLTSGATKEPYRPTERKPLPDGTVIGVYPAYQVKKDMKFLVNTTDKTNGGGKITRVLKKFNFTPSGQGLDGDHVMERQLGGPDELYNLWLLDSSVNQKGGGDLSIMTFDDLDEDPDKNPVSMAELKKTIKDGNPLWFKIRSTL